MMALIRNGGEYTIGIAVSRTNINPGEHFSHDDFIPGPRGPIPTESRDIGSGVETVPSGDCRYIQSDRVGDGAYAVAVRAGQVITSVKIGSHEFWEFDGENFNSGGSGDCKNNHGW